MENRTAWRARVVRVSIARTPADAAEGIDVLAELVAAPSREIGRRIVLRISTADLEALLERVEEGGS